jgi:transposase
MSSLIQTIQTDEALDPPAAHIGLDWGYDTHAISLHPCDGPVEPLVIDATAESVHKWLKSVRERFGGRLVVLGVETKKGQIINALLEHSSWLIIYPINPVTSARYRKAFTPSGAKDDGPDSLVLLELVRDHSEKLRPLHEDDPQTRELCALTELRRHLVDQRSELSNQLDSLLKTYYPQALQIIGEKTGTMAIHFLQRWPDLIRLKRAKSQTLRKFYYAHNVRRPELVEKRIELINQAVPLSTDELMVTLSVLKLKIILDQISSLNGHIKPIDQRILSVFETHPESRIFKNLPGAGAAMAPRLCAAFGSDRSKYPSPRSLQQLAGIAPVKEQSGSRVWIRWRWQAPKFLRQTFIEWAGLSVQYSLWAAEYYQKMTERGKPRHVILRALAFKWIRVLWKCWQDNEIYDETRYIEQLRRRKSEYAPAQ